MSSKLQNYKEKTNEYYESERPEIYEKLPKKINNLLDVGCASGGFGSFVKKSLNIEVWGIEPYEEAALKAKQKLDKVLNYTVEEAIGKIQGKKFDCISFNDVLEHLVDPYKILIEAKNLLSENGVIIFSVPNIRKINYMFDLVFRKDWKYEDSGIMDKTHLRFFTKKSVLRMINDLDFELIELKMLNKDQSFKANLINLLSFKSLDDGMYLQILAIIKPKKN